MECPVRPVRRRRPLIRWTWTLCRRTIRACTSVWSLTSWTTKWHIHLPNSGWAVSKNKKTYQHTRVNVNLLRIGNACVTIVYGLGGRIICCVCACVRVCGRRTRKARSTRTTTVFLWRIVIEFLARAVTVYVTSYTTILWC